MQRSLSAVLLALAVAAGVFAFVQYNDAAALKRKKAEDAAALKAADAELASLKAAVDSAKENIARLTAERDAALARGRDLLPGASPMPPPGAPPPAGEKTGGGMMEGIAKMFSTEDGRKMMRAQVTMGMKMQYGGLAKDLKLDPKVADQVMSLLADRAAAMTEATFAAMKNGGIDEAAGTEIAAKSEEVGREYDRKLKEVLGEQGMTGLKDYERTLGDRMMLTMHEQQFTAAGSPLEQSQRDGLLEIMKQERLKTPASAFDTANNDGGGKAFAAMRDGAAVEKWLKQEEDYQQRVLQAAPQTLNPDQVNALQEAFRQQLEMQKFGVTMGKQMFSSPGASATITVTPSATPAK